MKPQIKLDTATARWLAVQAGVDPKTVLKVARGELVRGMAGHRARAALKAAGLIGNDDGDESAGQSDSGLAADSRKNGGKP